MASRAEFGFPVVLGHKFRVAGAKYQLNGAQISALDRLGKIHAGIPDTPHPYWLLRYRKEVHAIYWQYATAALSYVIECTPNRNLRVLAIWLRGHCGGHVGTDILATYAMAADDTVRKEAVKALRRMNAWSRLATVVEHETNSRIRRLAAGRSRTKYSERLITFKRHVTPQPFEPGKQEFYESSKVDLRHWKPLKSVQFIREILERIHRLVSGYEKRPWVKK